MISTGRRLPSAAGSVKVMSRVAAFLGVRVRPVAYGGIELVVESAHRRTGLFGHQVALFASGDDVGFRLAEEAAVEAKPA